MFDIKSNHPTRLIKFFPNMIHDLIHHLYIHILKRRKHKSPQCYIKYLRKIGVSIGENIRIVAPQTLDIDDTRPSLVTIGDNVSFNRNFRLFTHDFVSGVFLRKYSDFINSSGHVTIGNNVRFGTNCTVLKGVSIGDNCFIAANSMVLRDIPSNSIAGGSPAKVLCTLDDYYAKRQERCEAEAIEFARSIAERFHRRPVVSDFKEEFPLFVDSSNVEEYLSQIPIKKQLVSEEIYRTWLAHHKAKYSSLDDFLKAAGL